MATNTSPSSAMPSIYDPQSMIAQRQSSQLEMLLRLSCDREQWRAIWEASSDGIALVGGDACFIEANPAFGRIFGHKPHQITGMEFLELLGCSDDGSSTECQGPGTIQAALQEQRALPYIEVDLPIKGVVRSIGLSITQVSLPGEEGLLLMVARDITSIRDATRMRANFLSMITHELRSPLNAINGYLDLALAGIAGDLNEQQREFVQRARSGSEHLYALVEDLLLVSRADAGQLRLNRSVLRLAELIANSVEEMELTAKDNGITIEMAIPEDLPRVYVDGVRLQQVLRNLLNNAVHFTPAGGHVTITARLVDMPGAAGEPQQAEHQAEQQGEQRQAIAVEVVDTGPGIAPEYHERIFERFFQGPPDSSGRTSGPGLGLSIVKMIVELHGGRVTIESAPGKGCAFTFTIPGVLS